MNSENSRTPEYHVLTLKLTDKFGQTLVFIIRGKT